MLPAGTYLIVLASSLYPGDGLCTISSALNFIHIWFYICGSCESPDPLQPLRHTRDQLDCTMLNSEIFSDASISVQSLEPSFCSNRCLFHDESGKDTQFLFVGGFPWVPRYNPRLFFVCPLIICDHCCISFVHSSKIPMSRFVFYSTRCKYSKRIVSQKYFSSVIQSSCTAYLQRLRSSNRGRYGRNGRCSRRSYSYLGISFGCPLKGNRFRDYFAVPAKPAHQRSEP